MSPLMVIYFKCANYFIRAKIFGRALKLFLFAEFISELYRIEAMEQNHMFFGEKEKFYTHTNIYIRKDN